MSLLSWNFEGWKEFPVGSSDELPGTITKIKAESKSEMVNALKLNIYWSHPENPLEITQKP